MADISDSVEQPSSSKTADIMDALKEEKLRKFYEQLDIDKDGRVDMKDLVAAVKSSMRSSDDQTHAYYAKQIMEEADTTKDQYIDFKELRNWVHEHDKKLAIVFNQFDQNKDGYIDASEIKHSFDELGIPTTMEDAEKMMKRMLKTGQKAIGIDDFIEHYTFEPNIGIDPAAIAHSWRKSMILDLGDDAGTVPADFTQKELESGMWWKHLVAGAVAGAVSRTSTAPFDRLKIFLQVHASRQNGLKVVTGVKFLLKEGGLKSFWRGNGVNVIKIAPETALKFGFYEYIKRQLKSLHGNELSIGERFISGSLAGAISQTAIYPMEVLKTRLALRKTGEMNKGLANAFSLIYQKEGLKAFYRGYVPNLIGIIPYAGIDLAVYETLKQWYVSTHPDRQDPSVLALLTCGTTSSVCGQLVSYPLALVRTRLQAHAFTVPAIVQPETMVGQFEYIIRNEGLPGLYRGITPNFMKVLPAVGISYVVYETVRKSLGATMS